MHIFFFKTYMEILIFTPNFIIYWNNILWSIQQVNLCENEYDLILILLFHQKFHNTLTRLTGIHTWHNTHKKRCDFLVTWVSFKFLQLFWLIILSFPSSNVQKSTPGWWSDFMKVGIHEFQRWSKISKAY